MQFKLKKKVPAIILGGNPYDRQVSIYVIQSRELNICLWYLQFV